MEAEKGGGGWEGRKRIQGREEEVEAGKGGGGREVRRRNMKMRSFCLSEHILEFLELQCIICL